MSALRSGPPYHARERSAVLQEFGTDLERGLSDAEAQRRMARFGPNQLQRRKKSEFEEFFEIFTEPMFLLLIAAAVVYGLLGEWREAIAMLVVLIPIAGVEFLQELRVERALEALNKLTAPMARIRRDGQERIIPAAQVVGGDVLLLKAGDRIPADGRLVEAVSLRVDEAALTGESLPANKDAGVMVTAEAPLADRANLIFAGTMVVGGRATAIVTATGMQTEIGYIARLAQDVHKSQTPFQKRMKHIAQWFGGVGLAICVLVAGWGIVQGKPMLEQALVGISLAMAAIPEALPIIITVFLAFGIWRMARRHVLVRHLYAVETLGAATVICSDKTGTLTANRMRVAAIYTNGRLADFDQVREDAASAEALRIGVLCNDAMIGRDGELWPPMGDPLDVALLEAAAQASLDVPQLRAQPRIAEQPFDNRRKVMAVAVGTIDATEIAVKGAPEVVLERCTHVLDAHGHASPLTAAEREAIVASNATMADRALRVLALATKHAAHTPDDLSSELTFVGLVGLIDPPRPEAKAAVAACRQAGIRVVMLTGDQPLTAKALAGELGIANDGVMTGAELDSVGDDELVRLMDQASVYARVAPEHKLRMVRALKSRGHVVAMTGDGVNDAPALRAADIGIAMGARGTDVARESAGMILTDDNFATIVAAVEEGRRIYDNLRKAVRYFTSAKLSTLLTALFATVLGVPMPLLPLCIIWLELIVDPTSSVVFEVQRAEPDVMSRPPRLPDEQVLGRGLGAGVLVRGLALFGGAIAIYLGTLALGEALEEARTLAFTTLVLGQLLLAWNSLSEHESAWRAGIANRAFGVAAPVTVALQLVILYAPPLQRLFHTVPVGAPEWLVVLAVAIATTCWIEAAKWMRPMVVQPR
jgi:P-type Ca2+ transporter type 2C